MAHVYVGSDKYTAVTAWSAGLSAPSGTLVRPTAPTVGNERVYSSSGGTTGGSEPVWNTGQGSTTTDNGITWTEVTGQAAQNGDGGGTAWAAPHARLANATATGWSAAGDTYYVSKNHAETQSTSQTINFPGTAANPNNVLCVDTAVVPPTTLAATGTVSPTATGGACLTISGYAYIYGLAWNIGTGTNAATWTVGANGNGFVFDNCTLKLNNSSSSSLINLGVTSSGKDGYARLKNCSILFGNTAQGIDVQDGWLEMIGGSVAATGSVPTTPFRTNGPGKVELKGVDLSTITGNIFSVGSTQYVPMIATNCKLHSGVNLSTGTIAGPGGVLPKMHNCDSAATNYRIAEADFSGTLLSETTIVRTGGASNGTTGVSWNIQTNASASWAFPYRSPEIVKWNNTTGTSVTATVEINSNNTLTNGDIWLEVEYLGDSGDPMSTIASSRKTDILASNTNVTSSAASWGGSLTTQQKLQVTFTPQMAGPVKARVVCVKASQQVYVDPLLTLA